MYTYIHISPPSCTSLPSSLSHPSRWSQSTELIYMCYAAASHQVVHIWQRIYVSATLSLHPSYPFPRCVLKSILYVYVFIPALPLGSSVLFFQVPYVCVSIRYLFFLFLTYFTLYDRLQVHPPHYKKLSFIPFYG